MTHQMMAITMALQTMVTTTAPQTMVTTTAPQTMVTTTALQMTIIIATTLKNSKITSKTTEATRTAWAF
jgi:hypothetical protein